MKTKAIVIPSANTVEVREVELKPLGAEDVLVRTTLTSISAGTERMLMRGVMPHPMLQFPVVPGYETVGEVIDAGADAQDWLGKRVYVGGNYGFIGVNPAFGGQSQFIAAPKTHLTDLQSLSDEQGVMLALAATALHGVDVAEIGDWRLGNGSATPPKDNASNSNPQSLLILGQGIVGQLAARFAKARGATVHVLDKVASRLRISLADEIVSPEPPPPGPPAPGIYDVLIDATGKMDAIVPQLMRVKKGGRVVLLGYYDKVELPYMPIFLRELTLAASREWAAGDLLRARDAIAAGEVEVRPLITHCMNAGDAPKAFDVAFNDPDCVKMILDWKDVS